MEHFPRRTLFPIAEEITPLDHQILCNGGTTSNIERLPSRLQQSKKTSPANLWERIEELTYEVSYLKAELICNKESKQALLDLHERMFHIFGMMEDALARATATLQQCERRYLNLWGLDPDKNMNGVEI
ncbi:hypothetical protein KXW25_003895 [Aspergillus fumigatus]|nr:hypothetical protein KXW25_003895 [Aspergillus fumigatus]KAH3060267.1 hypothetical protein KXW16_001608 [Aspergillus fumigatus]